MFSLNGTLKKKWVGMAIGNETIHWDGQIRISNNFLKQGFPKNVSQMELCLMYNCSLLTSVNFTVLI